MAHPDYIAAAKQGNRTPTVFMKVESADGETLYYTTQGQWETSEVLTNVSTDGTQADVGDVIQDVFPVSPTLSQAFGDFGFSVASFTLTYDAALQSVETQIFSNNVNSPTVQSRLRIVDDLTTPTVDIYSDTITLTRKLDLPGPSEWYFTGKYRTISSSQLSSSSTYYALPEVFVGGVWLDAYFFSGHLDDSYVPPVFNLLKPTAQVVTSPIDFGAVTSSNPIFSVDDITEAGALISYSYEYSDLGSVYTPGGSIVDGDSLVASRFYKITADFTTSTGGRGKIREFQLEEGLFLYFGSHIDEPFSGVSPQLVPNSVSGFSQKITIGKGLSTTGQSSVKMFWVNETSDLIASGYLKGQDVSIYSGFKGLSTEAYEPVIVGTWFDHSLDEVAGEITVKVQDAFKQFEKRKIPEEDSDPGTGEIDTSSTANDITFSATSLVTAMKQIFDEIGLRDRYISDDFDTLEAGDYAATKYKVSRVLHKPTEANKLLDELAQTGSMFLIPLGNGQIKPKPFDINQEHTAVLDADDIDFVNVKGNLDKFFTRFNSYYNPKTTLTADPRDDRDDFDNGVALLDSNAELRWFPEKGIKDHYDKWKAGRTAPATALTSPPQALIDKNILDNALLTEPLYTMTAKKMGPRFADIEPADVVAVDNLELPVVNNAWEGAPFYTGKNISTSPATGPSGIFFNTDMDKMYILRNDTVETILQFSLSTPGDVSTASYDSISIDISTEDDIPTGISFNLAGTKMYLIGNRFDFIYQYTLSTAWLLSSASYDSVAFDVGSETGSPGGMCLTDDGSRLYVIGGNTNIYQYTLSTAFDISTATYTTITKSVSAEAVAILGVRFKGDGKTMITVANNGILYQYTLGASWDVSTAVYSGKSLDISSEDGNTEDLHVSESGTDIYVVGDGTNSVYQYKLLAEWELEATDYTEGDRVIHDGKMWRARQDNTGKDPTSEATFWQNTQILENGLTDGKHFFVLGRKFNPNTALIELDLMEMPPGTLGSYNNDYSDDYDT